MSSLLRAHAYEFSIDRALARSMFPLPKWTDIAGIVLTYLVLVGFRRSYTRSITYKLMQIPPAHPLLGVQVAWFLSRAPSRQRVHRLHVSGSFSGLVRQCRYETRRLLVRCF